MILLGSLDVPRAEQRQPDGAEHQARRAAERGGLALGAQQRAERERRDAARDRVHGRVDAHGQSPFVGRDALEQQRRHRRRVERLAELVERRREPEGRQRVPGQPHAPQPRRHEAQAQDRRPHQTDPPPHPIEQRRRDAEGDARQRRQHDADAPRVQPEPVPREHRPEGVPARGARVLERRHRAYRRDRADQGRPEGARRGVRAQELGRLPLRDGLVRADLLDEDAHDARREQGKGGRHAHDRRQRRSAVDEQPAEQGPHDEGEGRRGLAPREPPGQLVARRRVGQVRLRHGRGAAARAAQRPQGQKRPERRVPRQGRGLRRQPEADAAQAQDQDRLAHAPLVGQAGPDRQPREHAEGVGAREHADARAAAGRQPEVLREVGGDRARHREAQQVQEGGGDDRHHRAGHAAGPRGPAAGRDGAQFRGLARAGDAFHSRRGGGARRERSAVRGRAGQGPGRGHGRAQKEEEAAHRSLLRGVILASTA